jgi:small subunit ribosomal protein S9
MSKIASSPVPSLSELTLAGDAPSAAPAAPLRTAKPADKRGWWWGTGRRKTAVCRVRIKPASGDDAIVTIASMKQPKKIKEINVYFTEERDRRECIAPLTSAGLNGKFRVMAKCHGGGFMGQAAAMKLAIARALIDYDPQLYKNFRDAGYLTRDAREVERKKYGQAGARRRFQFSKR